MPGRAQGCYKGFSSMILKEGLGNTVYFGSYELCKQVFSFFMPAEEK